MHFKRQLIASANVQSHRVDQENTNQESTAGRKGILLSSHYSNLYHRLTRSSTKRSSTSISRQSFPKATTSTHQHSERHAPAAMTLHSPNTARLLISARVSTLGQSKRRSNPNKDGAHEYTALAPNKPREHMQLPTVLGLKLDRANRFSQKQRLNHFT